MVLGTLRMGTLNENWYPFPYLFINSENKWISEAGVVVPLRGGQFFFHIDTSQKSTDSCLISFYLSCITKKGVMLPHGGGYFTTFNFWKILLNIRKRGKRRSFFSRSDMSKVQNLVESTFFYLCFLISLAPNLAHQKLQKFHFQSQFSLSKLMWIFLKMIFLFQYVNT